MVQVDKNELLDMLSGLEKHTMQVYGAFYYSDTDACLEDLNYYPDEALIMSNLVDLAVGETLDIDSKTLCSFLHQYNTIVREARLKEFD